MGLTSMPGLLRSIKTNVIPACFFAEGSVRTRQKIQSEYCAYEVQVFCPLTMRWSPASSAVVRKDARSLPEPGSEYP